MTEAYGTLLAQVIPVVMLASLLELRAFFTLMRRAASPAADSSESAEQFEDWLRERIARVRPDLVEVLFPTLSADEEEERLLNDTLSRALGVRSNVLLQGNFLPVGYALVAGAILVSLARSEVVSLLAASGRHVPWFEGSIALSVLSVGMLWIVMVPLAFFLYVQLGGGRFRLWIVFAAILLTLIAEFVVAVSIAPYYL